MTDNITLPRATVQQALEAHRMLRNWIEAVPQEVVLPAMPGIDGDWLDEVEIKLRTAWEQQQEENQVLINLLCRVHRDGGHYIAEHGLQKAIEDADIKIAKLNAMSDVEQQAEPVALEAVYETIIYWDEGGGKRSRRELAKRIVDFYTTPPQRKPLTDEQILDLIKNCPKEDHEVAGWIVRQRLIWCRAIEAAHNIKEQP